MIDQQKRQTEEVYKIVLNWDNQKFDYWVSRAHEEWNWLERTIGKKGDLADERVLIAGGSGRHAIAAIERGYGEVVFVDLASSNVYRIAKIKNERNLNRLDVIQADLFDYLPSNDKFSMIVCNGVIQHLNHPTNGLRNLIQSTRPQGYLYFDCYRAGILYWLLVEWCRPFFKSNEIAALSRAITNLCPDNVKLNFTSATLNERLIDDLFVPFIGYYSEKQVVRSLEQAGYEVVYRDHLPDVDHGLPCYGVIRFIIKNNGPGSPDKVELTSISNFELAWNHHEAEPTMQLLRMGGEPMMKLTPKARYEGVVRLFLKFNEWKGRKLAAKEVHKALQKYLHGIY